MFASPASARGCPPDEFIWQMNKFRSIDTAHEQEFLARAIFGRDQDRRSQFSWEDSLAVRPAPPLLIYLL